MNNIKIIGVGRDYEEFLKKQEELELKKSRREIKRITKETILKIKEENKLKEKEYIDKTIGNIIDWKYNNLILKMKILDIKNSYGKRRFLITPLSGSGEIWTEKVIHI